MVGVPPRADDGLPGTGDGIGRGGIEFVEVEFGGVQKLLQPGEQLRCSGHETGIRTIEAVDVGGHRGGERAGCGPDVPLVAAAPERGPGGTACGLSSGRHGIGGRKQGKHGRSGGQPAGQAC